jgi:hypothetical protein
MENQSKNVLSTIINNSFGIIIITIIPTIICYTEFFKEYVIDIKNNKMGILISLMVGIIIVLFLKFLDLKYKIIALKRFRDFESVSMVNFFNTEIKKLNDRLLETESKLGLKTTSQLNENEIRLFEEEKRLKDEKIIEYNKVFKSLGVGNYGIGNNTSIHKKLNYK